MRKRLDSVQVRIPIALGLLTANHVKCSSNSNMYRIEENR